ncbi:MAG TPA: alanine racemase, partial [Anaerolineaceae bacterium]|nr:alanine racemase [Anaerolineaceae bacterium]
MLYQTHVKIHLDNIRDNLLAIRERVGPDVKILPALKANAYGHGSVEVARVAEDCGMDWIGVATVPEGMAIRQAGVRLPILKLSPAFPEEMEAAIENDVTLSVIDAEYIQILQETAKRMGKKINVHLKVDTGMGRIGVRPET